MVATLVEAGVNFESKGAEWLLLVLEEAKIANQDGKAFNMKGFFRSLGCDEGEYKAALIAMTKTLRDAHYTRSVGSFIKEALN